jgi:hypothetical protein
MIKDTNPKPGTSENPKITAREERSLAQIIAEQNDKFRRNIFAQTVSDDMPKGEIVMTEGIAAQSPEFKAEVFKRVMEYDKFDEEADLHDWHEMGVIEVAGEKVWFKIDLYDLNMEFGTEDPSNLDKTRRVLTILFPSEY